MDSSVQQGIEFLDWSGVSENEVGELNNVLYGGSTDGGHAVTLPWTPPVPSSWLAPDHIVHTATYAAAVPPMVSGVQAPPPPMGHAGPPWVSMTSTSTGEEPVNGGPEEPVADGIQLIGTSVVSPTLPVYSTVYYRSPMPYPVFQNAAPDGQNAAAPRQRSATKVAKRQETQVRRNEEPPLPGNFSNQHQFSPNATQLVHTHPQVTQYYGAPNRIFLQSPMQFPTMTMPYPPVPYLQPAPEQPVAAVAGPAPVLPVVATHILSPNPPVIQAPSASKEEEDDDETVITAVIENSNLQQQFIANEVDEHEDIIDRVKNVDIVSDDDKEKEEDIVDRVKSPVSSFGGNDVTVSSPTQSSITKPNQPFTDSKPILNEPKPPQIPLTSITKTPPKGKTWASLLYTNQQAQKGHTQHSGAVSLNADNTYSHAPVSTSHTTTSSGSWPTPGGHGGASARQHAPNNTPTRKSMAAVVNNTSGKCSLPSPSMADDPRLHELGNFLAQYQLEHKPAALQPRGLTNRSNYCYINATLQALLACPPFYNLLKGVAAYRTNIGNSKTKSFTPIIDSMVKFMNEFEEMNMSGNLLKSRREKAQARKEEQSPGGGGGVDIVPGAAFEPTYVYKMLNVIRNDTAFPVEGRQEDAEEFLSCLLNGLHDEMLELQKLVNNNISNGDVTINGELYQDLDDSNEWKEVTNARNRQTITRRTEVAQTPLSQIFQGQLRSSLQRAGNESTDSIQPFFTLPLDIEKAQSVTEALERMVVRDNLEGVTCTKTNQEVEAWQQTTLEQLPLVLLLHLKCFDYKLHTCSKIIKTVDFSIDLKIEQKLMSTLVKSKNKKNNGESGKKRQYKLFAVVYHDGKEATKGHYITDVYHVGYGLWVRYDDATVKSVSESQVLHPKSPRVPYLLYYRRQDTILISQNARNQKSES